MDVESVVPTIPVILSTVTEEVASNVDVLPTIHERMEPQVIPSILPQETPSQDHTGPNLPEQFEKFDLTLPTHDNALWFHGFELYLNQYHVPFSDRIRPLVLHLSEEVPATYSTWDARI